MKFYLFKKCYFVEGSKNAAIYDLNNRKVFSINEYGKYLVKAAISDELLELTEEENSYLFDLVNKNLLTTDYNESNQEGSVFEKNRLPLNFAWLELTEACNLQCVHCYGDFGKPIINKDKILKTEDWKKVIDRLYDVGCRDIQLIGGEPMAHEGFIEILNYAYEKGMKRIDVFTNATLINEDVAKELKKCNANVRVSVYGHNKEVNDSITLGQGSFDKNKRGLELLKQYDIPTTIAVIIMKENEKYLDDIKKYIKSIGHRYSGYDVIRPTCFSNKRKHSITNSELLKSRYNIKPDFSTSEEGFIKSHFYNSCWNSKLAITSYGDILPCIFARNDVVANVKEDTNEQIEEKIQQKWEITKDQIEVCKDCEYRYCCHDCRPLAIGLHGDKNAKYPRCCYDPYKGEWLDVRECTLELAE